MTRPLEEKQETADPGPHGTGCGWNDLLFV